MHKLVPESDTCKHREPTVNHCPTDTEQPARINSVAADTNTHIFGDASSLWGSAGHRAHVGNQAGQHAQRAVPAHLAAARQPSPPLQHAAGCQRGARTGKLRGGRQRSGVRREHEGGRHTQKRALSGKEQSVSITPFSPDFRRCLETPVTALVLRGLWNSSITTELERGSSKPNHFSWNRAGVREMRNSTCSLLLVGVFSLSVPQILCDSFQHKVFQELCRHH